MRRAIAATSPVARAPFGVLFRFQIPHFNLFLGFFGFFSLCHFQFPLPFVSISCVEVFENCSGEEQLPWIPALVWAAVFF